MKPKKIILIVFLVIIIAVAIFFIVSSTVETPTTEGSGTNREVDIHIRESMFMTQVNSVHANINRHIGEIIRIEGFIIASGTGANRQFAVARRTPGCCGDDGLAGFMLEYEGQMPVENEWVEIIGVLETSEPHRGQPRPIIIVEELTVLETRGAEFVTR